MEMSLSNGTTTTPTKKVSYEKLLILRKVNGLESLRLYFTFLDFGGGGLKLALHEEATQGRGGQQHPRRRTKLSAKSNFNLR